MQLNLNAKRAERAAKRSEPMTVIIGDPEQTFELVPELPLTIAESVNSGDVSGAMRTLLANPADWDAFLATAPSMQDMLAIVEAYGVSLGESATSIGSSKNSSRPSRPTSNGSTDSTSVSVVGDGDGSVPAG